MARFFLQAGCLLALLAASALAADVVKGGVKQYDEEEHYRYEPDHYHYKDEEDKYYSKPETTTIHLQEAARENFPPNEEEVEYFESKFRCRKPADAADVCLHPAKSPYYEHEDRHYDSDDSIVKELLDSSAATCTLEVVPGDCPAHIAADCTPIAVNCTINGKLAADCGCEYDSLAFTATGYSLLVNASSCEEEYFGPSPTRRSGAAGRRLMAAQYERDYYHADYQNATINDGDATVVVAHINHVATNYGYRHVTGKVEFVVAFAEELSTKPRLHLRKAIKASAPKKAGDKQAGTKAGTAYNDDEEEEEEHYDNYYGSHYQGPNAGHGYADPDRHVHLIKGGNMKITLMEEKYY